MMRNQIREALRKYDKNKQVFQDDFRRGKISEDQYKTLLKIAENDYDDQIQKIYEQYGLGEKTAGPQKSPENLAPNPENPKVNPQNTQTGQSGG